MHLNKNVSNVTSETDKKRSLSVYCCTFSRGWPVKAAYILSIFCIQKERVNGIDKIKWFEWLVYYGIQIRRRAPIRVKMVVWYIICFVKYFFPPLFFQKLEGSKNGKPYKFITSVLPNFLFTQTTQASNNHVMHAWGGKKTNMARLNCFIYLAPHIFHVTLQKQNHN